jgi:hypothetical protein
VSRATSVGKDDAACGRADAGRAGADGSGIAPSSIIARAARIAGGAAAVVE